MISSYNFDIEGFFLPAYKKTNMRFIRDYLQKKKLLIKSSDIKAYNVPPYEELSVKAIFAQVKDDEEIMRYLNYYPDIKELPEHGSSTAS